MILTEVNNINPMFQSSFACAEETVSVTFPKEGIKLDFCHCNFECDYEESVFANPGESEFENDKSSFLYQLLSNTSTIEFTLVKESTGEEFPIVDNTYGQYYPKGSFTDHPLKAGVIIEWEKVFIEEGGGRYYLKVDQTNFTQLVTYESRYFKLQRFQLLLADLTVRIETIQNGYIEGGLDFTGLNWVQWIRVPGTFGQGRPNLEKENYLDGTRRRTQIQDGVNYEYTLKTQLINSEVSDFIFRNLILANEITVSDYTIWNHKVYRSLEVDPTEIPEPIYTAGTRKAIFAITFTDRKEDTIKRNFR